MGRDGWAQCTNLSVPFDVFVRPAIVDGRAVIAELRLADPEGITGGDLRRLRLDQVEASLQDRHGPLAAIFDYQDIAKAVRRAAVPKLKVKARLKPPERPPYPDEFYQDVAESYLACLQMGERPGPFLAGVWAVPTTSVHGWVKEARRRGILPPGRKGKAG
jgi:hypothetical protein